VFWSRLAKVSAARWGVGLASKRRLRGRQVWYLYMVSRDATPSFHVNLQWFMTSSCAFSCTSRASSADKYSASALLMAVSAGAGAPSRM